MNKKAQTLYQKELEAEGVFDARNIPETPTLLVRLLHHKPKEWGRVIDVFIEPDDPDGAEFVSHVVTTNSKKGSSL